MTSKGALRHKRRYDVIRGTTSGKDADAPEDAGEDLHVPTIDSFADIDT